MKFQNFLEPKGASIPRNNKCNFSYKTFMKILLTSVESNTSDTTDTKAKLLWHYIARK